MAWRGCSGQVGLLRHRNTLATQSLFLGHAPCIGAGERFGWRNFSVQLPKGTAARSVWAGRSRSCPPRTITSAVTGCLTPSWVLELDGAKTSCVVKIAGFAQVISPRVPHVKQSLFLHDFHRTGVSTPCLSWLQSAADSLIVLLCLVVQGCPCSSPTTLNWPQRNTFLVIFQVPFWTLTPFPFFCVPVLAAPWSGAKGAMSASALRSQPQQERVPVLAPHRLLASPRTLHPLCLRHSLSQCSAQLGLGQMPAFLLALGPSALPLFLFPFVYGTQSSSQAMRKCSALGQVEFLSRKIAQEFRAGVRSQACWAGCFVLSAPVLLEDLLAWTPAKAESAGCFTGCLAGRSQSSSPVRSGTGFANSVKKK